MTLKYLICSLILLLSTTPSVLTQTAAPLPQTEEQRKTQKEVEQKALGMLDEIIKDSESFKQAENRIRIRAAAAFILWSHDEPRARSIFREAVAELVDVLREESADDRADARKMFEGPRQLRGEMLQMLAQRDARMARELLLASRSTRPQTRDSRGPTADIDRRMDLNLATQIASKDPTLAADIARESLSQGLDYELPSLVDAIRAKDPDGAAKLASDILVKLRTSKLDSNGDARHVALSLLQIVTATPEPDAQPTARPLTPLLDQMAMTELVEMVTAEALRSPAQNGEMLSSLRSMMAVVQKYAPARAEQLRARAATKDGVAESEDPSGDPMNEWRKYRPLLEKGSADELLEAAAKAPPAVRDMLYQRAAMKLLEEGNPERARQIINEHVTDSAQREAMLDLLDTTAPVVVADSGKMEQSRKTLATLKTAEERVMLLAQLASSAAVKGDKKLALQLLEEARGMIGQRPKNINQLGAQLLVASAYAKLDPSRTLAILEPIVDQLNELLAAATILGGFFVEELVKDDEIMLAPVGMFFGMAGMALRDQYLGDVISLAAFDFDRTKALVDKFQRDEIRTMMRLLLAQSILLPTPTPSHRTVLSGDFNAIEIHK